MWRAASSPDWRIYHAPLVMHHALLLYVVGGRGEVVTRLIAAIRRCLRYATL